jgi:hypothetical protein
MARLRRRSMYYLAAAVSDFFLPTQKLVGICFYGNLDQVINNEQRLSSE